MHDVAQSGVDLELFVAPLNAKGLPSNAPAISDGQVTPVGSLNGLFFDQDQPAVALGRLAHPDRADQFVATVTAARLLGWHVGEKFTMGSFTLAQISSSGFGTPSVRPAREFSATLVGTVVPSDQVVSDDIDRYPTNILFTPATTRPLFAAGQAVFPSYQLRLVHGGGDVPAVEREVIRLLPPNTLHNFHVTSVVTGEVERATKPESIALAVFGVIAGLATLLIGSQAIGRIIWSRRDELGVLRALGGGPAVTVADSLFGTFGAVLVGAALAVVVAILLSPFAPIGAVRQVDPSPGFAADWTVLGVGFAVLATVLGVTALALAYRATLHRTAGTGVISVTRSSVASRAAGAGMPVAAVTGVRFALERGRGTTAVPVRSTLIGSALAVTLLVATITFGSGLNTLVSHPSLYGWNWDDAIVEVGGGQVPPYAQHLLDRSPVVASWTGFSYADGQLDGQTIPLLRENAGAAFSPPILSGHELTGDRQIVLGAATLAQLHKKVGDTVILSYGAPKDAPAYIPPTRLRIVGTATLPAIGNAGVLHPSMGTGGIVQNGAAPPAFQHTLVNPDPNLNGPALAAVRLRSGVSPASGLAALRQIARATTRALAADPNAGGTFTVIGVQRPAEIVNNRSTGSIPRLLALGLAVGALTALGLTLAASVRRRRRDLALLKTLGFIRRPCSPRWRGRRRLLRPWESWWASHSASCAAAGCGHCSPGGFMPFPTPRSRWDSSCSLPSVHWCSPTSWPSCRGSRRPGRRPRFCSERNSKSDLNLDVMFSPIFVASWPTSSAPTAGYDVWPLCPSNQTTSFTLLGLHPSSRCSTPGRRSGERTVDGRWWWTMTRLPRLDRPRTGSDGLGQASPRPLRSPSTRGYLSTRRFRRDAPARRALDTGRRWRSLPRRTHAQPVACCDASFSGWSRRRGLRTPSWHILQGVGAPPTALTISRESPWRWRE